MALTPSDLAANILDHCYRSRNLNDTQKQSAFYSFYRLKTFVIGDDFFGTKGIFYKFYI